MPRWGRGRKRGQRLRQEAWERGKTCKDRAGNLSGDLAGGQSRPVERGQQPEARLASWRVTVRAKRRQRAVRLGYGAPKSPSVAGSPHCFRGGGPRRHAATAWRVGPAGVPEPGEHAPGLPRNRRDLLLSLVLTSAQELPNSKTPGPPDSIGVGGERSLPVQRGYRRASTRARRDGVAGVGGPHSTWEAGERSPSGTGGGKGCPLTSNRWRETWRGHRAPPPCQRDNNG